MKWICRTRIWDHAVCFYYCYPIFPCISNVWSLSLFVKLGKREYRKGAVIQEYGEGTVIREYGEKTPFETALLCAAAVSRWLAMWFGGISVSKI